MPVGAFIYYALQTQHYIEQRLVKVAVSTN